MPIIAAKFQLRDSKASTECVVPENIHTPPSHGRSLEFPRGRGGQREKFPREGGFTLSLFSRVRNERNTYVNCFSSRVEKGIDINKSLLHLVELKHVVIHVRIFASSFQKVQFRILARPAPFEKPLDFRLAGATFAPG